MNKILKCPFLNRKCIQHDCMLFIQLIGTNPQTGQPVNDFSCAIAWLPLLMIENSQMQRQTGASVDKVATEISKGNETLFRAIERARLEAKNRKFIEERNDFYLDS